MFSLLLHHLHELVEVDGAVTVHVVLDHKVQNLVLWKKRLLLSFNPSPSQLSSFNYIMWILIGVLLNIHTKWFL